MMNSHPLLSLGEQMRGPRKVFSLIELLIVVSIVF